MIETLIKELEQIAKKNHDRFDYRIMIRSVGGKLIYTFVAEDPKYSTDFVSGDGFSPEEAAEAALRGLDEVCTIWDYKR